MGYSYNDLYTIHSKAHLDQAVKYSGGPAPLVLDDFVEGEPIFHFRMHFLPNGTCLLYNDGNDEMAQFDRRNRKLATAPTDATDTRQWFVVKPADISNLNLGCIIQCADEGQSDFVWDVEGSQRNAPILAWNVHSGANQRWEIRSVGS